MQMNMCNVINDLYDQSINLCNIIHKLVVENNLSNTQEYLDWLDKLNEISVRN